MLIRKYPHRLLQPPMTLIIIRALKLRRKPRRFSIRHHTQIPDILLDDLGFLTLDRPNAEIRVLLQHLLLVQIVEGFRGIGAGDLLEDELSARMCVYEVRNVVDFAVDDEPQGITSVVLGHFGAAEGFGSCVRHLDALTRS